MGMNADFDKLIQIGRPPNIAKRFPHSQAWLVSGKVIDLALVAKGKAMTVAANGRNSFIIRGTLMAAQCADATLLIKIAHSESNYCPANMYNIVLYVDSVCNELDITIPVAVHADRYGIKGDADIEFAKMEIPVMFDAGITSIALDASHMEDDQNLLANLELNGCISKWAGLETEVGEIKGLNTHGVFADWIVLNNGSSHGLDNKTIKDNNDTFIKTEGQEVSDEMWQRMTAHSVEISWEGGNYKNLNLPFENLVFVQERTIRERMSITNHIGNRSFIVDRTVPKGNILLSKSILYMDLKETTTTVKP